MKAFRNLLVSPQEKNACVPLIKHNPLSFCDELGALCNARQDDHPCQGPIVSQDGNVSERGGYRLVAKGIEGRANVVYLLALDFPEIK